MAITIDGRRVNFNCPAQDDNRVFLLGSVQPANNGWQIVKAVADQSFMVQSSDTVLVMQIELSDGSRCTLTSPGTTITVDGKRASFLCSRQGDNDVFLLGDIQEGDKGWQITKAVIGRTDKGFVVNSSQTVDIRTLGVGPQ